MHPVTIHLRTYRFSVSVVRLLRQVSSSIETEVVKKQLMRSATSIGANVLEAQQASSKRVFIQYMSVALRSSRETGYWLRLLHDAELLTSKDVREALNENSQISKILASILLRARESLKEK